MGVSSAYHQAQCCSLLKAFTHEAAYLSWKSLKALPQQQQAQQDRGALRKLDLFFCRQSGLFGVHEVKKALIGYSCPALGATDRFSGSPLAVQHLEGILQQTLLSLPKPINLKVTETLNSVTPTKHGYGLPVSGGDWLRTDSVPLRLAGAGDASALLLQVFNCSLYSIYIYIHNTFLGFS
jgi:hypothetical protein